MKTGTIYRFENKINGMSYVGCTTNLKKRVSNHKSESYNSNTSNYNTRFHEAIRTYGIDNFKFEIIATGTTENCFEIEKAYIKAYNSVNNGYNVSTGGKGGNGVARAKNEVKYHFIHDVLGWVTCTQHELSVNYGLHRGNVNNIVSGRANSCQGWRCYGESDYTFNDLPISDIDENYFKIN